MGGLNVYQLTITKRREAGSIRHKKKHVIYIQARLHAAETHGSLIMSKIIKEFSENYKKYDLILSNNIIKLVPMVNPDGVVLGNSRSSLAGVDLNRRWGNPNATIHPELYFLKVNMKAT
jgi:murein tripeptide amidase MpaA